MKTAFVKIIALYQRFISPMLGKNCRFEPTCSEYAKQSLHEHGVFHGVAKTMIRICKCHPFHAGGFDPVIRKEI